MPSPTGSQEGTATDRLIRLLTMLPAPRHPDIFEVFWNLVAEEHRVDRSYVTGKIAVHLHKVAVEGDAGSASGLAKYALFFFGEPGPDLLSSIADEVDPGAPNSAPGRAWVEALQAAALEIIYEAQDQDDIRDDVVSWAHHFFDND